MLDEIAYLTKDSQAKLLRVIETREFERLGGRNTIKVDARLIALTNVDLTAAVNRRDFREDLFYRLNVVHIQLPPLRERAQDLPQAGPGIFEDLRGQARPESKRCRAGAAGVTEEYEFPGNVRELANTIERAVIIATGNRIEVSDLPRRFGLRCWCSGSDKSRNRWPRWKPSMWPKRWRLRAETRPRRRGYWESAARIFMKDWRGWEKDEGGSG